MEKINRILDYLSQKGVIDRHSRASLISSSLFEEKYLVVSRGKKTLLSVSRFGSFPYYQSKRDFLKKISDSGVLTYHIIDCGDIRALEVSYALYTWINGDTIKKSLQKSGKKEAYNIGIQSGKVLKRIHNISFDTEQTNKASIKSDLLSCLKNKENYKDYRSLYKNIDLFYSFLEIAEREYCFTEDFAFLHGDFNVNNLIIYNGTISVVDWSYDGIGDTSIDFVRNLANARINSNFARGLIDGYFQSNPNIEFWQKLKVYSTIHQIKLLSWYNQFEFVDYDFINEQHNCYISQYGGIKELIPQYYK